MFYLSLFLLGEAVMAIVLVIICVQSASILSLSLILFPFKGGRSGETDGGYSKNASIGFFLFLVLQLCVPFLFFFFSSFFSSIVYSFSSFERNTKMVPLLFLWWLLSLQLCRTT